ncbi:Cutinase transcription factor 1 alpha [Colletotrichum sidae]|uniref:Cutinase transcription factor 1 alpha n=1 Tax=Colletotrichum sidae TaxID=1347389 RepID=A0A4R8TSP1_9PEZI|nr:Cutinase transcription factor 1 alpha [Colletotrichum sidae]
MPTLNTVLGGFAQPLPPHPAQAPRGSPEFRRHDPSPRGPPSVIRSEGLVAPSPSQKSQGSDARTEGVAESHTGDIDTGFLHVYAPENQSNAEKQALEACLDHKYSFSSPHEQDLQESFAETYWDNCYTWCPVLDPETLATEVTRSPLLANAIAAAASHVQPPLVAHEGPAAYYKKARTIFYEDEESDGLTALMAVSLFYWWAPRSPSTVHRHSSWWWTSVLIRHAQQMNLHREPTSAQVLSGTLNLSLRRRIWWTAFARERLTALCQSKPAIIDPDDCNIQELSLSDFPSDPRYRRRGEIFIQWVRLCMVIGRIAKTLSRSAMPTTSCTPPDHHRQELVNWVNSLPLHLQLPIGSARTQNFDRDVHQLYLPYLTTIIVLHLKRSANTLPEALPPAILAASCIARIMRDILSRGNTRFLMAISCWYCGTAFIPLLQACRIPHLAKDANDCLDILERAVEQLQLMWGSANVIREGFKRLRTASNEATRPARSQTSSIPDETSTRLTEPSSTHTECQGMKDFDWMALFPFVTQQTGGIAESLLMGKQNGTASRGFLSPGNFLFHDNIATQFEDLFEPFVDYRLDFMVPG